MPDSKSSIPHHDSWIEIAPGGKFHLDAQVEQEWNKRKLECRELRGNVLALCFEIEFLLDQLIIEALIPTSTQNADGQDLLDGLFLKGPATNFRTKIDILRKLRSRVARLEPLLPESIVADLTTVREVRNDFAHYPVTFQPTGEAPNQNLIPVLVSRRGRFVLDDAFLQQHGKIIRSTLVALESAFKALRPSATVASESG